MNTEIQGNFRKQLQDYRLTTAEIIYHLPDHPSLLQSFIWQELDIAPRFPILRRFLHFWETKLDGKLFKVTVAHQALIKPSELRYFGGEFIIH
ncbi:MAG: protein usg [Alphaproteobacteria bacterium]